MALQLIDLDAQVSYIDVKVEKVPYKFSVKLSGRTFTFEIKYNDVGKFFTIDLYDPENNPLAFGDPVRYGRPLFNAIEDQDFPIPVIIPYCITSEDVSEVTPENFGKEVKLYLHDRRT